jgi:hypothetical protein
MVNCKLGLTPMPFGMKLTFEMFPPFDIEVQDMALILYV